MIPRGTSPKISLFEKRDYEGNLVFSAIFSMDSEQGETQGPSSRRSSSCSRMEILLLS